MQAERCRISVGHSDAMTTDPDVVAALRSSRLGCTKYPYLFKGWAKCIMCPVFQETLGLRLVLMATSLGRFLAPGL